MATARDLLLVVTASIMTLASMSLWQRHTSAHMTTTGRVKSTTETAFVLSVGLQFSDEASATKLKSAWAKAAAWCLENEPFLYAYEMAQSDKDNLSYVIQERYRSKADYLGAHRRSPAFKDFRPQMRELQDSGKVVVTGHSYQELGLGFT